MQGSPQIEFNLLEISDGARITLNSRENPSEIVKTVFPDEKTSKKRQKTQKPSIFEGFSCEVFAETSVDRIQRHGGLTLGHIHK